MIDFICFFVLGAALAISDVGFGRRPINFVAIIVLVEFMVWGARHGY